MLSGYAVPAASLALVKAPLADRFSVITFDYPGSGSGRTPWLPLTTPGLAAQAVRVLDHLGLRSAHVYGLSLGGLVAQELAIRFPERVRRLVLGATMAGGARARRPDPWTFTSALSALAASPSVTGRLRVSGLVLQAVAAGVHDTSGRLARIQADTLVLHGERDLLVPLANAVQLHEGIASSTLAVLRSRGHEFAFEDPDLAAATVLAWFSGTSALPGRRSPWELRVEPWLRAAALPVGVARANATAARMGLVAVTRAAAGLGRLR